MENEQNQNINTQTMPEKPVVEPEKSNFLSSKWLKIGMLTVVVLFIIGGAYLLLKNQAKKGVVTTSPTQTKTIAPKITNLNPNTGTLYGDIKVRLHQVLK